MTAGRRGKKKDAPGRGGGQERRTRDMIDSWLARCVLQCLQPKILSEFR